MRKHIVTVALFGAVGALLPTPPLLLLASPAEAATCGTTDTKAVPDFDSSGGPRPDFAISVPGEDLGTQADAGLVEIRYAGDSRTPQGLSGLAYRAGDRFGTAIVASDFDRDGCTDLLVGAPGRDVGGVTDAGSVEVYQGSPTGLRWHQTITMDRPQAGARFGGVLAAYSGGPYVAGLPLYDVPGAKDAGAVVEFDRSGQLGAPVTQNAAGIPGVAEAGDHFGAQVVASGNATARTLETSAPLEDGGGATDAGVVFRCSGFEPGSPDCASFSQDSPGVPGSVESGDRFGAALALGYIGIPGEDIGSIADAGMVVSMYRHGISQDTRGVAGAPEAGDQFGAALVRYVPPQTDVFHEHVQIGVPGEDLGGAADAGMVVTVLQPAGEFSGDPPSGVRGLSADVTAGTVDAGDRYGATLGSYRILDAESGWSELLLIGSPGAESGAGEVIAYESLGSEALRQVAGAPEPGDGYGLAVSSLS